MFACLYIKSAENCVESGQTRQPFTHPHTVHIHMYVHVITTDQEH